MGLVCVYMSVCLSVCLSVCVCLAVCQDYCKTNRPILLKLGVTVVTVNGKNQFTFSGDLVPDTDFGSIFHFPQYYKIGHFSRLISISHTVTGRFSRNLTK